MLYCNDNIDLQKPEKSFFIAFMIDSHHFFVTARHRSTTTLLLGLLFLSPPALADTGGRSDSAVINLSLAEAVAMAQKNNPLTEIGRLEVDLALEKSAEITGKFLSPRLQLESFSGLVSEARGDVTDSPDTNDEYNDLGPFFKVDLKLIQPLYTFGKYSSATEAGRFSVMVQEAMLEEAHNELAFSVTRAYLALVAGRDGHEVGRKLTEHYDALLKRIAKMLENNEPEITDSHLLETRSMLFEITRQAGRGMSDRNQAALILKGLLGLAPKTEIAAASPAIPSFQGSPEFLARGLEYGRTHSRQLRMIEFGLSALEKKAELESNMKFPDLFLAAGAGYGTAPNRDKQTNPFISDDYNYEKIGAVLGLKWDYNYQTRTAVEKQSVLDYLKLAEKKKLAVLQLDGEIRKSYLAAERQWHLLRAAGESLQAAKQWIRLESDNLEMGIGDVKRLIGAYKQYFLLQADEIETRYNYLVNLAQLAKTLGNTKLYLQWETNGEVRFDE